MERAAAVLPRYPADETLDLAERIARGLPGLERFVRCRMGPELRDLESASDIVQSTARELLRSGHFVDRGEGSFERWLRVAAEHKLKNRARYWRALVRSSGRTVDLAEETVDGTAQPPSADAALEDERERLARAVARLPESYRHVLRRVQMEGAPYEEVAGELGCSAEAVRKRMASALARLSTLLGAERPIP